MISLATAKKHLKVNHDLENDLIEADIAASYEFLKNTLNKEFFEDQAGYDASPLEAHQKQLITPAINKAVLLLVGHFYENRSEVVVVPGSLNVDLLRLGVDRLIAPYRNWGEDDRPT